MNRLNRIREYWHQNRMENNTPEEFRHAIEMERKYSCIIMAIRCGKWPMSPMLPGENKIFWNGYRGGLDGRVDKYGVNITQRRRRKNDQELWILPSAWTNGFQMRKVWMHDF